jgi:cell shape-determining protein MreD
MIRIVRNAASTFLVASIGFLIAAVVARNTAGFESWSDGLATTYLWNFALAVALYALLAVLLVGHGVVRLIASRRTQP